MTEKLDYIKGMGYNAVWISPTLRQAEDVDTSYHGYWFGSFYETNPWIGTDDDLINFVKEAHKRDIWVMADVVYNHVGNCFDNNHRVDPEKYSCIKPFDKAEHYHPRCDIKSYDDPWQVINCRIAGLPDLNQENPYVKQELISWAKWYQKKFNFDGFRVDTVKHIDHHFWKSLRQETPWFNMGEIFVYQYDLIRDFMTEDQLHGAFNYPMFDSLKYVMGGGNSMDAIHSRFEQTVQFFGDRIHDMGTFFENHDNERFLLHYNDPPRFENQLTMIHMWAGIPFLLYGAEQDMSGGPDPDCRRALWDYGYNTNSKHYQFIKKLNWVRNNMKIGGLPQTELGYHGGAYAFSRGNKVLVVLNNQGSGSMESSIRVKSPFEGNA